MSEDGYLTEADQIMRRSNETIIASGGVSDDIILAAEELLKTKFPKDYILFLKKYGTLSFNGIEFYGITKSGLAAKSIPCVVFATNAARLRKDISNGMIKIKASGYGPSFCIYMEEQNKFGVGSIIETSLNYKSDDEVTFLARSFSEFFLSELQNSLE